MRRPGKERLAAALGALMLCGALAPAAAAQTEPPRRVRMVRADTASDTAFMRVKLNMDQVEQMMHELMASRAMEQTIGMALREAASGQAGDQKKIRELSDELGRIAQKNASLITTIQMSCAHGRQPEGYIGVQIDELQTAVGDEIPSAPLLREYPRIDSVYANSPAARAGLRRGDVVLLMGGVDARRPVPLQRMLRPSKQLPLRVQRDGATRDVTLLVEKRPADFNSDCANVDQVIGPEFEQPMIVLRTGPGQRRENRTFFFQRTPEPPQTPEAAAPPMPPPGGFMYGFTTSNAAIAGATLMAIDDDWRATLGVDNGVLVTKVLPGTPSKDSGLHAGDVIISADGQTVASVRALSRIVGNASGNAVRLQIIRAGKPQQLVLRWQEKPQDD